MAALSVKIQVGVVFCVHEPLVLARCDVPCLSRRRDKLWNATLLCAAVRPRVELTKERTGWKKGEWWMPIYFRRKLRRWESGLMGWRTPWDTPILYLLILNLQVPLHLHVCFVVAIEEVVSWNDRHERLKEANCSLVLQRRNTASIVRAGSTDVGGVVGEI